MLNKWEMYLKVICDKQVLIISLKPNTTHFIVVHI